ncbi:MAG TPA: ribbon-helix-helix domain-containing protein [Thermoanaerobaculia bacterium]
MKALTIEIPDQLAKAIEELVEAGRFASEEEIVRLALTELVHRYRPEIQEQLQRDDVLWALKLKG